MLPALVHPGVLERRRLTGADLFDEVWDGVLHMVPPPSFVHQTFAGRLFRGLGPIADALRLELVYETGLFSPTEGERDYRTPDLIMVRPEYTSARGVVGPAELVVEILSPHDESRDKLSFYAALGVREIWLIEPESRVFERWIGAGGPCRLEGDGALGFALDLVDGPRLRIRWRDHVLEV